MEKKFNLQEPFYDAILAVKPGEFSVGLHLNSSHNENFIDFFKEITGLTIKNLKKGKYYSDDSPSYNITFNLEGVTQYEMYLIRKNIMNNYPDIYINNKFIVLPEYRTPEILNSYGDYIENMSTMGD